MIYLVETMNKDKTFFLGRADTIVEMENRFTAKETARVVYVWDEEEVKHMLANKTSFIIT